jgi:hypothetical protein
MRTANADMKYILLFLLITVFSACGAWQRRQFIFSDEGVQRSLTVSVPRGFKSEEKSKDADGSERLEYSYSNGAKLYFARLSDTTRTFQFIDSSMNIPRTTPFGGTVYKGMDSSGLWWSEIRIGDLRFGYENVPPRRETRFDQAIYGIELDGIRKKPDGIMNKEE